MQDTTFRGHPGTWKDVSHCRPKDIIKAGSIIKAGRNTMRSGLLPVLKSPSPSLPPSNLPRQPFRCNKQNDRKLQPRLVPLSEIQSNYTFTNIPPCPLPQSNTAPRHVAPFLTWALLGTNSSAESSLTHLKHQRTKTHQKRERIRTP